MENFNATSNGYNVLPVKIHDCTKPWDEVIQFIGEESSTYNCIVVEPEIAKDPLDIRDPLPIFNDANANPDIENIYGSYIASQIENPSNTTVIKTSVFCLKNSSSLKHISNSTNIAMTDMFKKFIMCDETGYLPYIIINTRCDSKFAPLNSFAEIVREITSAYVNCFNAYPTIFVAFADNEFIWKDSEDENPKKSKKDKKKKKKNKKKNK